MIDLIIVLTYFTIIMVTALSSREKASELTADGYFLSNRNLRWPSIALSTIATNIQGYQFFFIFVPLYLRDGIVTITQFIRTRLGNTVGLFYSIANILLFSTITLGAALFWGAYAADLIFEEYLDFIHSDRKIRISILLIGLGIFSAIYTYLGGLSAVVKTDVIQFFILFLGGTVVLFVAIHHLGGWSELYQKTPEKMHLHLPDNHEKLPWTHVFGLFLLNINYWCANQSVIQRSLAAKSLREAQIGLMVGGVMKYVMAVIIVIPGIALYGILKDQGGISDPDMAFPYLVKNYLPNGIKGIILCALFASLMSTVHSTFNSLSTLFSIDIYKTYLNKSATDQQIIQVGRRVILVSLVTGIIMGLFLLNVKIDNSTMAFTHTLNELRYYINCGIVVLICTAAFFVLPNQIMALVAFLSTIPLQIIFQHLFPEMNYFVRAGWVIIIAFSLVTLFSFGGGWRSRRELIQFNDPLIGKIGLGLAISLLFLHIVFH